MSISTGARTAAQAAQDKNKASDGKFQHNTSAESSSVVLSQKSQTDQLRDNLNGTKAMNTVSYRASTAGVGMYLNQLASSIREHYPTAKAAEFDFGTDVEFGVTATFGELIDGDGKVISTDKELYGRQGFGAFLDYVDPVELQEQLEWDENEDGNAYILNLDEYGEDEPAEKQAAAAKYLDELGAMQKNLEEQRALAAVSLASHKFVERFPEVDEFTLGTAFNGRTAVETVSVGGKVFENPKVTGDNQNTGDIEWFHLDGQLDPEVDLASLHGRAVKTKDALAWSPGQPLGAE